MKGSRDAGEVAFKLWTDSGSKRWQAFCESVGYEDGGKDVPCASPYSWKLLRSALDLVYIAVFFSEGAVPDESREPKIEQLGESAGF